MPIYILLYLKCLSFKKLINKNQTIFKMSNNKLTFKVVILDFQKFKFCHIVLTIM